MRYDWIYTGSNTYDSNGNLIQKSIIMVPIKKCPKCKDKGRIKNHPCNTCHLSGYIERNGK